MQNKNIDKKITIIALLLLLLPINICEPIKGVYALFYIGFGVILIKWLYSCKKIQVKGVVRLSITIGMILLPRCFSSNFFTMDTNILKYEVYIFIGYMLSKIKLNRINTVKQVSNIGFIHVLATLLLLLLPSFLYKTFALSTYGKFPIGTENGLKGYTAGINSHYSANALYISVVVIAIWSRIISKDFKNKKEKKINYILFILSFFALLLTEKRAHLLFCSIAMLRVFLIVNKKKMKKKKMIQNIIILIFVFCIIITFLFLIKSKLISVLYRFSGLFSGADISSGRFSIWAIAVSLIKSHLFTGIGWQQFMSVGNSYFNVHNVYLQILCETGVFGLILFFIYLTNNYINLSKTIKIIAKKKDSFRLPSTMYFSYCFQLFFILYCLTGNCLYDNTLFFYAVAAGIGVSSMRTLRIKELINEF